MSNRPILVAGLAALAGFIFGAASNSLRMTPPPAFLARAPSRPTPGRPALPGRQIDPVEIAMGVAGPALFGQPDLHDLARFGGEISRLDSRHVALLLDRLWKIDVARTHDFDDRLTWLFDWWMKRDPAAARAWIDPKLLSISQDGSPGAIFGRRTEGSLVLDWARASPREAAAFVEEHAHSGVADRLLAAAMETWPPEDRQSALRAVLESSNGANRGEAMASFFGKWGAEEPGAAFARAQTFPNGQMRKIAVSAALSGWSKNDPEAALAGYEQAGCADTHLLSSLVGALATKNPAKAADYTGRLDPIQISRIGPEVAERWAGSDPVAALNWALANGVRISNRDERQTSVEYRSFIRESSEREDMKPGALDTALIKQPKVVLAWISGLPPGPERDSIAEKAADADALDLQQTMQLISTLPQEAVKRVKKELDLE
jgi:hypothetical protein